MAREGVLARMGRLIAGITNAAIDKAEGTNPVAIVEQAIREIDDAAEEARLTLGQSKAEEYRIKTRRGALETERTSLDDKIRLAVNENRDDLAKAAIARQIDLESQITALDKALSNVSEDMNEGQQALQAILATRREAEERLSELKRSLTASNKVEGGAGNNPHDNASAQADRAASAVARVTGVPKGEKNQSSELDELDRLHRDHAIAERLARFKTSN